MGWFISQSLVFIILAFIVGVIAGRLWKNAPEKPTDPPAVPDELERIEGIGPAMANALRAAGIRTFAQLAESDDETKRSAVKAAGLSFAPSLATWSRQARLLADGDEAAFSLLTARLVAGRDTEQPSPRPAPKPTTRPTGNPIPAAAPAITPATGTPSSSETPSADPESSPADGSPAATAPQSTVATPAAPQSAQPGDTAPSGQTGTPLAAPDATRPEAPNAATVQDGSPSAVTGTTRPEAPDATTVQDGSPSAVTGTIVGEPATATLLTGAAPDRTAAAEPAGTGSGRTDDPSAGAGTRHAVIAVSGIPDSSGLASGATSVAVLDRAEVVPAEEKAGDPTVDKPGHRSGKGAGPTILVEKNAGGPDSENNGRNAAGDKSGIPVVNKNDAPKKAGRKKSESRKNDSKKGDRTKPSRDSGSTNR